ADAERGKLLAANADRPAPLWFGDHYNLLLHGVIEPDEKAAFGSADSGRSSGAMLAMSIELIRAHPARWLLNAVGQARYTFNFFLIGVALLGLVAIPGAHRDPLLAIVALACVLWVANIAEVCIIEVPLLRYSFYTDMFVVASTLALAGRYKGDRCAELPAGSP